MKRKKLISTIVLTIISATLLASCTLLPEEEMPEPPPVMDTTQVAYRTVMIERGSISNELKSNAVIKSAVQADLFFSKFGGHIGSINITRGNEVLEGDVLLGLDIGDLEYSKSQSYYNYARAKLTYNHLVDTGASEYQIQMASYNKSSTWLTYEKQRDQLEASTLIAPFDGTVTYLADVRIGDYVNARKRLITLSDPTLLMVVIPYDYTRVGEFATGAKVMVVVQGVEFDAVVIQTPYDVPLDMAETEYNTQIEITGSEADMEAFAQSVIIGDVVQVVMVLEAKDDVVIISKSAVSLFQGRAIVYVLEDGVKIDKVIETGIATATKYEVVSGLEEGDLVVTN